MGDAHHDVLVHAGGTPSPIFPVVKRAFDIVVGVTIAVLATPVIALFALVLAVQARGWPFFVHHRIGTGGSVLLFPKLRTLGRDTHRYLDKTTNSLQPVSGFARWLRETHLDELPQIYLVPLGRLSLVGPRPRMHTEAEAMPQPHFDHARIQVRQGCTGMWQVGQHQHHSVSENPEYDLFYLRHASMRLDLWILWRTLVQAVRRGDGLPLDRVHRWLLGGGFGQVTPMVEPRQAPEERGVAMDSAALG